MKREELVNGVCLRSFKAVDGFKDVYRYKTYKTSSGIDIRYLTITNNDYWIGEVKYDHKGVYITAYFFHVLAEIFIPWEELEVVV